MLTNIIYSHLDLFELALYFIKMAFPLLFMSCSLLLLLLGCAKSEVFTVGDADLWRDGTTYDLWSRKYTFHVGDVLEFKYSTTAHNVYEVTKATYQSCDARTGVVAKYRSGDDKIELKEARPYWFLCNVEGHCLGGMRFGIDVAANATSSAALSPSQSATQPPPPPSSKANRTKTNVSWPVILTVLINIIIRA